MSAHMSLHVHRANGESLVVDSAVQHIQNVAQSAYIKLRVGSETFTLYMDDIEAIDRLAFEASNLAREAREAWQNTQHNS